MDKASDDPSAPGHARKARALAPDDGKPFAQGAVKDEALIALHVSKGLNGNQVLASPPAIRSAAGYFSAPNHSADNSHVAGFGFVSQNWNTGQDAQTQGATNMSAQYGTATGSFSSGSPSP
ncbi:hypothetical protein IC614_04705 [Allosphingosinicella flava]|uniref:Uncharacterized protein n=1 Tax=Allosphingosinicella flava TaxID=2771430 RepID=A0A7T2GL63_9SPHN|nr:hypothetical protein [Sphingosinicella flava]QPQ55889.1 hypothetical protein IC614_04705 [Sphingosinicella flava]